MPRFYPGLIVWASIKDGFGRTKQRPAVILALFDEADRDSELLVVPITKPPQQPCPPYHVQVHDSTVEDPSTGLYYPCWAKCNWAGWLEQSRVKGRCGNMPDDLFEKILDAYESIYNDDRFTDWQ